MRDKMKECPFCGFESELTPSGLIAFCTNSDCNGMAHPSSDSKESAVAAWNRRTSPRLAALERVAEAARLVDKRADYNSEQGYVFEVDSNLGMAIAALDNLTTDGGRKK